MYWKVIPLEDHSKQDTPILNSFPMFLKLSYHFWCLPTPTKESCRRYCSSDWQTWKKAVHFKNLQLWHLNLSLPPNPRCTWKEGSCPLLGCDFTVITTSDFTSIRLEHSGCLHAGSTTASHKTLTMNVLSATVTTGHYLSHGIHLNVNKCTKCQIIYWDALQTNNAIYPKESKLIGGGRIF